LEAASNRIGFGLTSRDYALLSFSRKLKLNSYSFESDGLKVLELLQSKSKWSEIKDLGANLLKDEIRLELTQFTKDKIQREFLLTLGELEPELAKNPKYRDASSMVALSLTMDKLAQEAFRNINPDKLTPTKRATYRMLEEAINFGNNPWTISKQGIENAFEAALLSSPLLIVAGIPAGVARAGLMALGRGVFTKAATTSVGSILSTGSLEVGLTGGTRAIASLALGIVEGTTFDAGLDVLHGNNITSELVSSNRLLRNSIGFGAIFPGGRKLADRLFKSQDELTRLGKLIESSLTGTSKELAKYFLGHGQASICSMIVLESLSQAVYRNELKVTPGFLEFALETSFTTWGMDLGKATGSHTISKADFSKIPGWIKSVDAKTKAEAITSFIKNHPELVPVASALAVALGIIPAEVGVSTAGLSGVPDLTEAKLLGFSVKLSRTVRGCLNSGFKLRKLWS